MNGWLRSVRVYERSQSRQWVTGSDHNPLILAKITYDLLRLTLDPSVQPRNHGVNKTGNSRPIHELNGPSNT